MRASSVVFLIAFCAAAWPQAFGRFGYSPQLDLPGIKVTKEQFAAKHDEAAVFRFAKPAEAWNPAELTDKGQIVTLNQYVGSPFKIKCDLFAPGFSMYFPLGIDLGLETEEAPYLTWDSGSVMEEVPTPSCSWILVSFKTKQPPVLFVFQDAPSALVVTGQPGAWRVRSEVGYKGWVRVVLPFGSEPISATTAAELGALASRVVEDADIWLAPAPRLIGTVVESDEESVTASWRFSSPGAVVPNGAVLAGLGGYPLKILSDTRRVDAPTEDGPLTVSTESEIRILFPTKRIPTGRFLGVGPPAVMDSFSPEPYAKASELALQSLSAGRTSDTQDLGEEALTQYLGNAPVFEEPWTGQRLFHDEQGQGLDDAAAHALLMQALTSARSATSEDNALLTSIEWRTDWHTWQVWTRDRTVGRRTAALASIAAALCPETPRRLQGAMLQAGLSAERGLGIWKRLKGDYSQPLPKHLETYEGLRRVLFLLESPLPYDELGRALTSEIRFYSDPSIQLLERDGKHYLTWFNLEGKPDSFLFASGYPIRFGATANLAAIEAESEYGMTELRFTPADAGLCELELILPEWARPLPQSWANPRFVETVR